MKNAKSLWLTFIMAWGSLLNFAPQPVEHHFDDIDTNDNTISSHFDAAWRYPGNAIDSEGK